MNRAAATLVAILLAALAPHAAEAGRRRAPVSPHEAVGFQNFASPQSNPIAVSPDGSTVYVANTTSGTVSIVSTGSARELRQVPVGLDPVGLAVRPDGLEVWVANHVSDSVSVIDTDPASSSYATVVETVQALDGFGVTLFDEPVGIAFSGPRAFVTLSSRDQVAVVDTATYQVTSFIPVRAQEPRAIAARSGLVYVAAFESGNQSQIGICLTGDDTVGSECGMGLTDLFDFATNPNLPGAVKNIVKDATVPDRDLFVYDAASGAEVAAVTGMGTLLYGLAVSSQGRVFVTQTDARNAENGDHGQVLDDLDNRMFDNELAAVTCSAGGCGPVAVVGLEPPGSSHATAFATPYGVALSADDSVLLATAAASSRLASFDAASPGIPLDVVDVGSIPRGLAFHSTGAVGTAYVLDTLANTVSVVAVGANGALTPLSTIPVGSDPTPEDVRRGRIAFNDAFASTSGNFSCASCHPDGNTDQLLWRIGGACEPMGCDPGDEPRTTMPVRGLADTLPLHWDGTLGDPFGGGNGAVGFGGSGGTSCSLGGPDGDRDCFLHLVEGSLAGVMCDQSGSCPGSELGPQEREDMAVFLASVAYPPARSRRIDDSVSRSGDGVLLGSHELSALQGFADFFLNQNGAGDPQTCADSTAGCHALPLGADTNSSTLNGFDVPTMRGMTDRFLQFSLGPTANTTVLAVASAGVPAFGIPAMEPEIAWSAGQAFREITVFGAAFAVFEPVYGVRPLDLFQMFEEASTGSSGALGRQLTLNTATAGAPDTAAWMDALEAADARGVVNLRAVGLREGLPVTFSFRTNGRYETSNGAVSLTAVELRGEAAAGASLVTLTAALRSGVGSARQPLLDTFGSPSGGGGALADPPLPTMSSSGSANPGAFPVAGVGVSAGAVVFLDGEPAAGAGLSCGAGASGGICNTGRVDVDLASRPAAGLHLLQVQNPSGLLSNEIPFCVGSGTGCLSD